ncbi:DUF3105 domain-containing protein [Nocardioides sp.]|uniref:DUF3105 domain-containing protein n=1 Tax=Nocardioides sp. TaxID=35761 RepID=UPI002B27A47D|nr:DUF3105 domain-containing protein [Nocardioides sp.]
MAKPSKSDKSARQALIDSAMKKQRSAEKRRSNIIVTVCVIIALGLIGAASYQPIKNALDLRKYSSLEVAEVGAAASVCQDVVTEDATDVNNHVPQGTEVTYETSPPAFGPHWNVAGVAPAPFTEKFYDADDRPELEALVHNLEHGYTILWYDESVAEDAGQISEIKAIAKKFDLEDTNFRLKFIAAPWLSSDEDGDPFPEGQHVAMTHWKGDETSSTGVWQYCSETSGEALETFMADYPYTDSPESGAL